MQSITACPVAVQSIAELLIVKPVTVKADIVVNKASIYGVVFPVEFIIGNVISVEHITIITIKQ